MLGFQRLVILAVIAAGGMAAYSIADRNRRPLEEPMRPGVSRRAPTGRAEPLDEFRNAELARRAKRPLEQVPKNFSLTYDEVLKGGRRDDQTPLAKPAETRPSTSCRSVEPAPKHPDNFSGPHSLHHLTTSMFISESGFGLVRMRVHENKRGVLVASADVDRVELVSLLTDYQPSVYVLDEMATPVLAKQAKRRSLDEFERLGLDAIRRGEDLLWTREAPTRLFGAIRADKSCLECHTTASVGDLLGAFTYYLDTPVDRLGRQ